MDWARSGKGHQADFSLLPRSHMLAMKGLSGLVDDKWNWTPHDADWIIPEGPTGHLHEVYWNV